MLTKGIVALMRIKGFYSLLFAFKKGVLTLLLMQKSEHPFFFYFFYPKATSSVIITAKPIKNDIVAASVKLPFAWDLGINSSIIFPNI